ncbi:MAG: hypothetical protein Q7O66_04600 [Dehalococcoidia bacterium]|nr:hypothetical protein [Dehalococcoidia bacterium]
MSQPGVTLIEAHFPEGTGVLVYDSNKTSAEAVVKIINEKTKYKTAIVSDRPMP